ncbi:MAG: hypothetical protein LBD32_00880 [Cytophagales bacterium]|nr:hypothetical protein [Cytophagales bacterium]
MRNWSVDFIPWLIQLEVLIDAALTKGNNIAGFKCSGIHPVNRHLITASLPSDPPSFLTKRERTSKKFILSNKVISSKEVLEEWNNKYKKQNNGSEKEDGNENLEENDGKYFFFFFFFSPPQCHLFTLHTISFFSSKMLPPFLL